MLVDIVQFNRVRLALPFVVKNFNLLSIALKCVSQSCVARLWLYSNAVSLIFLGLIYWWLFHKTFETFWVTDVYSLVCRIPLLRTYVCALVPSSNFCCLYSSFKVLLVLVIVGSKNNRFVLLGFLCIKRKAHSGCYITRIYFSDISANHVLALDCSVAVSWFSNIIFGSGNDCVIYQFDDLLICIGSSTFKVGEYRIVNQAKLVLLIILRV